MKTSLFFLPVYTVCIQHLKYSRNLHRQSVTEQTGERECCYIHSPSENVVFLSAQSLPAPLTLHSLLSTIWSLLVIAGAFRLI